MEWGTICKNILGWLPKFDTCVWNHCYRKVNEVSHIMAHSIANCNNPIVIMDIPQKKLITKIRKTKLELNYINNILQIMKIYGGILKKNSN